MKTKENLITKILKSVFFKKSLGDAGSFIKNPKILLDLIQNVIKKSKNLTGDNFVEVRQKISLLVRMVKAFSKREYTTIPIKSITSIVAALVYFISPIDFIPDFLPVIGLTDDFALLVWLFNALADDIETFRIWEREQKTVIIG